MHLFAMMAIALSTIGKAISYFKSAKAFVAYNKAVPPPVKCGEKKCEAPCESKAEAQPSVTSGDVENITKEIIRRLSAK